MALVVGGVTVTGTQTLDASKLTGTASAINGSNITSLPAPTSSQVTSAITGLSVGAVGSFGLLSMHANPETMNPGATKGGSNLEFCTVGGNHTDTTTQGGTWRIWGHAYNSGAETKASFFIRIS